MSCSDTRCPGTQSSPTQHPETVLSPKYLPEMLTVVPPVVSPVHGQSPSITACSSYSKSTPPDAKCPPSKLTCTSTTPPRSALGELQCNSVEFTTVAETKVVPNLHPPVGDGMKFLPRIVTIDPPPKLPTLGVPKYTSESSTYWKAK
eukprot:3355619-Rhodomonas_salina.2